MPFNSDARRVKAIKQKRDEKGHFIPLNPEIKVKSKSTGAANVISRFFKTEEVQDDESIVKVSVNNPFKRIIKLLEELKSKQATTLSLRFTIPLIALPIVFFLAFQLGRSQVPCQKYETSLIGNIKNILISKKENPPLAVRVVSFIPFMKDFFEPNRIVENQSLLLEGNNITTILNNSSLILKNFEGKKIILTGVYSTCENTFTLENPQNLNLY